MPPPGANEYASHSLVGDQTTPPTGSVSAVTAVGHPPSAGTIQIWGIPVRSATNAIRDPSGENVGELARPTFAIRATVAASSAEDCAGAPPGVRISMDRRTTREIGGNVTG